MTETKKANGKTPHTTFRFTSLSRQLLAKLAEGDGVTMTATLERLIRGEARRRGLFMGQGK